PVPRPMTHDLFISVLEKSNMSVERVEITDLKDRTFYSRLVIKQGLKRIVVDSRPSDSLGIASRVHCPVYIAESIVDEAGVAVNLITDEEVPFEGMETHDEGTPSVSTETPESAPMDERTRLEALLQKAVDEENYEEAARIRDRIQGL
ncbi:MAG: bifunctional nuclease domain-containing protein, partial [Alkalispirochaeta sp.]